MNILLFRIWAEIAEKKSNYQETDHVYFFKSALSELFAKILKGKNMFDLYLM